VRECMMVCDGMCESAMVCVCVYDGV